MNLVNAQSRVSCRALLFDTFGTVVDWRGSIIAEGKAWGQAKGIAVDWGLFADRWRAGYMPSMNRVHKGELPWTKLDALHRMILDELLKEFRITGLTEQEKITGIGSGTGSTRGPIRSPG
jgi:2-haloacid dehalogenase